MSQVVLLRHALAGHKWRNPIADAGRGLDQAGRDTAARLPGALLDHLVPRALLSSPFVRCTQTMRPAAERFALRIETRDELLPDVAFTDARRLLLDAVEGAVLCTHGELITRILDGLDCEKGAFWIVDRCSDAFEPLLYVPPPGPGTRLPNASHS